MTATKNNKINSAKRKTGFFSDALDRARKVFESTTSKAEKSGRRALKFTEEIAESVSHKTEAAMEATVKKIKDLSHDETASAAVTKAKKPLTLMAPGGTTLENHLDKVSSDLSSYLEKNGEISLDKIINVMKRRKNTQIMIFCAIGWLLHKQKINIGADGTTIAIKK